MMWMRKIVRRKTQFTIIMLLTMMASAILTACISFTIETQQFVDEYYSVENSPMCFAVSGREDAAELILEDKDASKVVSKIVEGKAKYITDVFYVNDKKISNEGNFAYDISNLDEIGYPVTIAEGEEKEAPGDGEIWISHIFAKAYDVQVGDNFKIGDGQEYRVSAIVNTALCSSGFIDAYPFYVNEKTLKDMSGTEGYVVNIFTDDEELSLRELQEVLPEEFAQSQMIMLDKETLKMCLNILAGIFGGVGVVAAIIILVVSMVVFRYLVRATIAKEYQMIGIYKALGRDNREIKRIYLTAYMVAGMVGMLPGFFLARPLAGYLGRTALGGNREFVLTGKTTVIGIAVILFMGLVLLLNVYSELKKVHSISPIQAMNLQNLSSKEKLCKSVIPNASSSAAMAVNGICKRKGMSLLIIMILTVSVYMDVMAGEVALTLSKYAQDRNIWENLPDYDCMIKTMGNEEALKYIQNSKDVEDYVQVMLDPVCSDMKIEGTQWTADEAHPMIYENFNEKRYENVPFTKGRICLEKHEIAVSEQFLTEVGKEVGDYIKISFGEKEINCLIVGSYSAMMKGGASFYMQEEDFRELGFKINYDTILVFLNENVDYDKFSEEFEKVVDESQIYKDFNFVEREGDTVREIANPICVVLSVAFAAFSVLNIVNMVHTQLKENRRKYGILKAMGFTTGYICRENVISFTIQYVIAVVVTILLSEWISPIMFSLACGVRYICKPAWLVAAVAGAMYVILMMITLLMLRTIKNIKPVELMEE